MPDLRIWNSITRWREALGSTFGAVHTKAAPGGYKYLGFQQLSSTSGAAFALTVPPGTQYAEAQVTAANIYYDFRAGGSTPSSTVGMQALIQDVIPMPGYRKALDFRAVRQGASNFTLNVFYFTDERDE